MSATDFGALTIAQRRVWSADLWQAGRDQSFFFSNGFIGKNDTDMNSVIQRVTKLTETERGLECVMQLVQDLQGDGVVGDNQLEGNEEQLVNDAQVIRFDQIRNGTRSKGQMAEQATVIRFRATSKEKLSFWLSDKMDELMFLTLSGRAYSLQTDGATRAAGSQLPSLRFAADVAAPSTNRIIHAGSATSKGTVTASDKMSWDTIVRARSKAERKRLRPIRSGGREHFVMVMSSEQRRDLVLDPTYQTLLRTAEKPSSKHPLFTGAMATVDGVILHSHNKVFSTLGLASGKWGAGGLVDGAQAMLLGAQAGGIATIGNVAMNESDNTDYKNRPGLSAGRKIGMLKPQFKSIYDANAREDFGTIAVKTAASE